MKNYIPVIIVFMIIAGAVILFAVFNGSDGNGDTAELQSSTQAGPLKANANILLTLGEPKATATVVEYFDYKCPSCNNFHQTTAQEINRAYVDKGQAKYEIRITPIIGPDSANAGRGAYCANDQGFFESYHETIIEFMHVNYYKDRNYSAEYANILTTNKLAELAAPLGIDEQPFKQCVDSDKYNPNLDENLLAAADDSVRGTPGFTVGEQSFVGGQPFSVFKTLIDIELR